jgi:hypothetical protein
MVHEEKIGPGISIAGFDSSEEMFDWMATTRAEVQARTIAPEQAGITYGSYAVRFIDDLIIFNRVPTLEEQSDEHPGVLARIDDRQREANMLWVWGYSKPFPDGELGYSHRSVLWPITTRTFLAAQMVGWDVDRMDQAALMELSSTFRTMAEFVRTQEGGKEG